MNHARNLLVGLALAPCFVHAEIEFDGTLGPPGSLSGDMTIVEAMGTRAGPNLFHSFTTFNVNSGESATFTTSFAGPTDNIVGRVTGAAASNIDGRLASDVPGASLWLINPNGVIFGAGATLDLQGSLYVATADYLRFDDGAIFSANNSAGSSLSVTNPAAFGFLSSNPAALTVDGADLSGLHADLALVGGPVAIQAGAYVDTAGGQVLIAAAGGPGEITATGNPDPAMALTRVDLAGSTVESSGGGIYIVGDRFVMSGGSALLSTVADDAATGPIDISVADLTLTDDSLVETRSTGAGNAASIAIDATDSVTIATGSVNSFAESTGNSGDLTVNTRDFLMQLSSMGLFALGTGAAGTLTVNAADSIHLEGGFGTTFASNSFSEQPAGDVIVTTTDLSFVGGSLLARAFGSGDGGNIVIDANALSMENGTQFGVGAFGTGTSGNIRVNADTVRMSDDIGYPTGMFASSSTGYGGDVILSVRVLDLMDGAQITNASFGPGSAGNIAITASERISITGRPNQTDPSIPFVYTGVFANTFGGGDAGNIDMTTPLLELSSSGSIQASTFLASGGGNAGSINITADTVDIAGGQGPGVPQGSFISAMSFGDGVGGSIDIDAGQLSLSGESDSFDGIFARAVSSGSGGNIAIRADSMTVGSFATVDTAAFGAGDAGTVSVETVGGLSVLDGGQLAVATVGAGNAGSMILNVGGELLISGQDANGVPSTIHASSLLPSAGAAGSMTIDAGSLTVDRGGQVAVRTASDGAHEPANLDITVTGATRIAGVGVNDEPSGIFADTSGSSAAGNIQLTTDSLSMTDGAVLQTNTVADGAGGNVRIVSSDAVTISGNASIVSNATGAGAAGDIVIDAGVVSMNGGVLSAGAAGVGQGGDIVLNAPLIALTDGALVEASSSGEGAAGNITMGGAQLNLQRGATIATNASQSPGGNVDLTFTDLVYLYQSRIDVAANGVTPTDNGGNVVIDPEFVVLNSSQILATANAGTGGNIRIVGRYVFVDANSVIDASSRRGVDGTVAFDAFNDEAEGIVVIEAPTFTVADLLRNRCAANYQGERSSLIVGLTRRALFAPNDVRSSPPAAGDFDLALWPNSAQIACSE